MTFKVIDGIKVFHIDIPDQELFDININKNSINKI